MDVLIVNLDGRAARGRKHVCGQLRRPDVFPHKAAPVAVDQDRAERGQTKSEPALAVHRDVTVTLIAVQKRRRRAERLSPGHAAAVIARAADVQGIGDFRHEPAEQGAVRRKATAGQQRERPLNCCSRPRMRARTPVTAPPAVTRSVTSASLIRTMLGIRSAAAASVSKYSRPASAGVP